MKRIPTLLVILAGLPWLAGCRAPADGAGRLVLHGVTLIDGTQSPPSPSRTIIVDGHRIEAIVEADSFEPRRADTVIDGRGLWAIPGLWDAHVHLSKTGPSALPALVARGVTSVRDMGGDLVRLRAWAQASSGGERVGPRIYMAGPMLEAPATLERMRASETNEPYERTRIAIPDTARAREVVDSLATLGVDFIKIREYASAATYTAVVRAARARGLRVAGHAPFSLPAEEGASLGLASFEHASYPYPLDTIPAQRKRVLEAFRRSGVTIVPTLVAWETHVMDPDSLGALVADRGGVRDARMRVVSPRLLHEWRVDLEDIGPRSEGYYDGYWGFIRRMSHDLGAMHAAGIPLAAGSDLGTIALFPGFSLHDEVERLVEWVGLTSEDAIRAATRVPAGLVGAIDSLGTLEVGKVADLVLLTADPTAEIGNLRRVHAVVLRGELLGPDRIAELLDGVALEALGTIDLVRAPEP